MPLRRDNKDYVMVDCDQPSYGRGFLTGAAVVAAVVALAFGGAWFWGLIL